jgi:uncharacterized membrane protein
VEDTWGDGSAPIFSENHFVDRGLRLGLPVLLVGLHLLALALAFGRETMLAIAGLMLIYELPPAGKETVIPAGILLGYPWWAVAASIALVDVWVALFMVWNFDLAERIPVLGPWVRRFIAGGRAFLAERPWLSGLYFFGIVLMAMIPFAGSGGVRGSIAGRLLGMSRLKVMAAITIGAFAGSFLIAFATLFLQKAFVESIFVFAAALLLLLFAGVIVYWLMRRVPPGRERGSR